MGMRETAHSALSICSAFVAGSFQLSEKDLETVKKYAGDDRIVQQFLTYASRARCVRECKAKTLSATQRYPDPEILKKFKLRESYSFLHFAYYKVKSCIYRFDFVYNHFVLYCLFCVCSWITMRKAQSVSSHSCSTTWTMRWCREMQSSTARIST